MRLVHPLLIVPRLSRARLLLVEPAGNSRIRPLRRIDVAITPLIRWSGLGPDARPLRRLLIVFHAKIRRGGRHGFQYRLALT